MRMVESMVSGIEGTAEVLYPENDFGAPDWRSTDMASRTLRYLEDLPPHRTQLVGALFVAADVMLPLSLGERPGLKRVPLARRREAFERWYKEPFSPMGQFVGALKATLAMTYFGHPSVVRYIGQVTHCDRPSDPFRIDVDVDYLVRDRARVSAVENSKGGKA
ncbi:MAG: hypothetical protein IPH72_22085 [Sandaracinaceae bacterium]|nr:hypothetical protein [Sandaracinaceae bacterium]MBK8589759.1 hypothetical protein [Sandaracinaceae bacterium]